MNRGVFISYRPAHRIWAERVRQALEKQGVPCRMVPRTATPAAEWLTAAQDGSQVLILSSRNQSAKQFDIDIELAKQSGLEVVPLLVEQLEPPQGLARFVQDLRSSRALRRTGFTAPVQNVLETIRTGQVAAGGDPSENLLVARGSTHLALAPAGGISAGKGYKVSALVGTAALAVLFVIGVSVPSRSAKTAESLEDVSLRQAHAQRERAIQALRMGQSFASTEDWTNADLEFTRAIEIDHGFARAYLERAIARFSEGKYPKVLADFASLDRLDPALATRSITLRILAEQAVVTAHSSSDVNKN